MYVMLTYPAAASAANRRCARSRSLVCAPPFEATSEQVRQLRKWSRPLLVVAAVLCVARPARAQRVTGGVEGGVDCAAIQSWCGEDRRFGWLLGGFATVPVAGRVAIQPEVVYIEKGDGYDYDVHYSFFGGQDRIEHITETFHYLQIPVLLRVRLNRRMDPSGYVLIGPALAVLARADQQSGNESSVDFTNSLPAADVGLILAAGFTNGWGGLEVRLDLSRTNLGSFSSRTNHALSALVHVRVF
jgi:hypothetical protein